MNEDEFVAKSERHSAMKSYTNELKKWILKKSYKTNSKQVHANLPPRI